MDGGQELRICVRIEIPAKTERDHILGTVSLRNLALSKVIIVLFLCPTDLAKDAGPESHDVNND